MAFDESNWGNTSPRKSPSKPNYSPSASYNYSPNGNYQSQSPSVRRRPDRNNSNNNNGKRHSGNGTNSSQTERLIKQNDMIISLLEEIRDRLPEPEQLTVDTDLDEQFEDEE